MGRGTGRKFSYLCLASSPWFWWQCGEWLALEIYDRVWGMVAFRAGRCPEGPGAGEAWPHGCTRAHARTRTGAGPWLLLVEVSAGMVLCSCPFEIGRRD